MCYSNLHSAVMSWRTRSDGRSYSLRISALSLAFNGIPPSPMDQSAVARTARVADPFSPSPHAALNLHLPLYIEETRPSVESSVSLALFVDTK